MDAGIADGGISGNGNGEEVASLTNRPRFLANHHHIVGEDLVSSRGDNASLMPGNPGGHKTLPYRNVRVYRGFRAICCLRSAACA
jgi:hypothetical protein